MLISGVSSMRYVFELKWKFLIFYNKSCQPSLKHFKAHYLKSMQINVKQLKDFANMKGFF